MNFPEHKNPGHGNGIGACVLAISGSDSSGAAGLQIDLKTIAAFGCHGLSSITAVTAQTLEKFKSANPVSPETLVSQLEAAMVLLEESAIPFSSFAVKVGMLATKNNAEAVADFLENLAGKKINLVVDPVLLSSSGAPLLEKEAYPALFRIFKLATVITPNLPEAQNLTGVRIVDEESKREAAQALLAMGARAVLIKGGHEQTDKATDLLFMQDDPGNAERYESRRHPWQRVRGTGCSFSSAIAALLARGNTLSQSIQGAKEFISLAIEKSQSLSAEGLQEKTNGAAETGAAGGEISRLLFIDMF